VANFFLRYRRIIIFIIAVVAFFWLVWTLRNVLLPFIIGLILAYLLFPLILWLEKRLPLKRRWQGSRRVFLIILVYLLLIAIIAGIGYLTVPIIVNSLTNFFSSLPQIIPDTINRLQDWTNRLRERLPPEIRSQVDTYISNLLDLIAAALQSGLMRGLSFITASFGLIAGFASLPIFLFYLLRDAEKLNEGFYSSMSAWTAEQARGIVGVIRDVMGRYIRAQIVLGIIVGTLVFIGLMILKIPYAPALAFVAGLTELIPLLGPWIGGAAGVIVTLATEPSKTVWVVILYFAVQLTENTLLVPRISGGYLGIHPTIILILIVVGGHFAGIWGIILILPLAATLVGIYKFIVRTTRKEGLKGPES
jgi:predicted PurR-regulated permease PerM